MFLLLLLCLPLSAEIFHGRVVKILDGDTLQVQRGGGAVRVRLYGIDAPEADQPWANQAAQHLTRLAQDQQVLVEVLALDQFARFVGIVRLRNRLSLNQEMIRAGLAWWYQKYAPKELSLKKLEAEARAARRGLWADSNRVAPWAWRPYANRKQPAR